MASQSVKIFFNDEIRRFTIEGPFDYQVLVTKVSQLYPDVEAGTKLAWKDADGDLITFTNDDELKEAMNDKQGDLLHVYLFGNDPNAKQRKRALRMMNESMEDSTEDDSEHDVHKRVTCDYCGCQVKGSRYKCLICRDYDLCERCSNNHVHDQHPMIRIANPKDKSWRQAFRACRQSTRMERGCRGLPPPGLGIPPFTHGMPPPFAPFGHGMPPFMHPHRRCHHKHFAHHNSTSPENNQSLRPQPITPDNGQHLHQPPCPPPPLPPAVSLHHGLFPSTPMSQTSGPFQHVLPMPPTHFGPPFPHGHSKHGDDPHHRHWRKWAKHQKKFWRHYKAAAANAEAGTDDSSSGEESAPKPNAPYLQNVGEIVSSALRMFGIDAEIAVREPGEKRRKYEENMDQGSTPVPTNDSAEATMDVSQEANASSSALKPTAPLPNIQIALDQMLAMGFTNEGGWLANLLIQKGGNISAVLDVLQPNRNIEVVNIP